MGDSNIIMHLHDFVDLALTSFILNRKINHLLNDLAHFSSKNKILRYHLKNLLQVI